MLNADLIIGAFTAALTLLIYFVTRDLSKLGGVFVNYVLIIMGLLSLATLAKGFLNPDRVRFFESVIERNNILIGVLILFIYLVLLPLIGFLPASYIFYFVFNMYLAEQRFTTRNIINSAVLTLVVVTCFYFLFHHFLEVPLPQGAWFE